MLLIEDYDDDLHADPIKLCFDENHNSDCSLSHTKVQDTTNMPNENQIPTVDLTRPRDYGVVQMPKPILPKGGDVCYTIKQLAVKLVDIKKFPWYYKRYIQDYAEENDITKGLVVGNSQNISSDICMKIKYDTSKGQWKVHGGNTNTAPPRKEIRFPTTTVKKSIHKIDFKRNKGLVGMTIIPKIKEEKVCSSSAQFEVNKCEVVRDKVSNENDTCILKNALINKDSAEMVDFRNKIVLSSAAKSDTKENTEDKREDPIIIDKNIKELVTSEPLNLLDVEPNKLKINLKLTLQTNTTSSLIGQEKLKESSKLKFEVHTDVQKPNKYIQQEQNQDCEVQPRELSSSNKRKQLKKTMKSVEKTLTPPASNANHNDISSVPLVSERKVAVIDSTSQKFANIKKFVEKANKIAPTNTSNCSVNEASICNKSKPLDMPLLTDEKHEKSDTNAHHRISLKDSIVFENDLNSNDYFNCKELKGNNITLSAVQPTLEKNNLVTVQQPNNQPPPIDGNVSIALLPTPSSTHTIPVINHINTVASKPRIKYTPVTRDYIVPLNASVTSTNQNTYTRNSSTLLHNPSTVNSVENNTQNRNLIHLLNTPAMPPNSAGIIQNLPPVQQMPQFSAPSYQLNYPNPPGYATPVSNGNIPIDFRMYTNNGRNVNPDFYYPNMYSGYTSTPQPRTPQWQMNTCYNQKQTLLRTPNSSIMGWINGNMRKVNTPASSAPINPTVSNTGDKRSISVDTVRTYSRIPNPTDVRPLNKNGTIQTANTNHEVITNKQVLLETLNKSVTGSSSTNKALKRPYKKKLHLVKRPLPSTLENSHEVLSKRSKTAPLPVSSHVKDTKKIVTSRFFAPIANIPTYEMLSKVGASQPTKMTAVNMNNSKEKCDKQKMPTASLDKSKKISIEEYKKRIGKSDRADLDSPVGNTKDRAGLVPKYTTKTLKDGKYNLDQDLGYSSDTTVKL